MPFDKNIHSFIERPKSCENDMKESTENCHFDQTEDLIHLQGPLTEEAVLKTLQARFYKEKLEVRMYKKSTISK